MMTAHKIMREINEAGVSIAPTGDGRIVASPSDRLNDRLRNLIRQNRKSLLALLSQPAAANENPAPAPAPNRIEAAAARVEGWLKALDSLPKPRTDDGRRLKQASEEFALGHWAFEAIRHGWTDGELFGRDGVVVTAWRQGWRVMGIEDDAAWIGDETGQEKVVRPQTDGAPWWAVHLAKGR